MSSGIQQSESYLHVVEDEKERVGVELVEEFWRVQHGRRRGWVVGWARTRVARKICSAHRENVQYD